MWVPESTTRHPGKVHAAWEVASSLANRMQAGMSEIHSPGAVEGIGSQMPGSRDAPEYSIWGIRRVIIFWVLAELWPGRARKQLLKSPTVSSSRLETISLVYIDGWPQSAGAKQPSLISLHGLILLQEVQLDWNILVCPSCWGLTVVSWFPVRPCNRATSVIGWGPRDVPYITLSDNMKNTVLQVLCRSLTANDLRLWKDRWLVFYFYFCS